MSVNTTNPSQPTASPAVTAEQAQAAWRVEQARTAWLTAGRDTELDRWNDLYDLLVPRPDPEAGQ